jgi:hypothetical protein
VSLLILVFNIIEKIEDFRDNGGEQKIGNIESIAQTYSEHVSIIRILLKSQLKTRIC